MAPVRHETNWYCVVFFFFLETEEEMTCILFVVGLGIFYSRPVLKIFLLLLLLLLARTYGCTLLGENLFSSAMFFLPSGFVLFQHTLAGWLSDKWKRLTHPDFTAVPSGPPVGVRGNRGNGLRSVSSSFFSLDDDGDLFVNKRASKCVRTASSWLALRFFFACFALSGRVRKNLQRVAFKNIWRECFCVFFLYVFFTFY